MHILVNKVHTNTSTEFNIYQEHSPHSSSRLRCHGREEFINKSEVVGLDYPVFSPTSKMIKDLFDSMEENRGHGRHDRYANEFMESSKFMVSADIPLDIKKLEGATNQLYEWIDKEIFYNEEIGMNRPRLFSML